MSEGDSVTAAASRVANIEMDHSLKTVAKVYGSHTCISRMLNLLNYVGLQKIFLHKEQNKVVLIPT